MAGGRMTNLNAWGGIVLFSGPGGVTQGLKQAGITNTVGVEYETNAVATARAAGHAVIHGDVTEQSPTDVANMLAPHTHTLMQSSAPCQGLSMAGKGVGRQDLENLLVALQHLGTQSPDVAQVEQQLEELRITCSDERSPLTLEVMRWIAELTPAAVMLEQVPTALPIWQAMGDVLTAWGYSVWAGNVQAEQYGVPQTRKRAFLTALRSDLGTVGPPKPTHSKYYPRTPDKLDPGVQKWVSMAEALGWGMTRRPSYTVCSGGTATGGAEIFGNGSRQGMRREIGEGRYIVPTHSGDVVNRKGSIRPIDTPAPAITSSADNGNFRFIDATKHSDYLEGRGVYERIDRRKLTREVESRVNNQSGTAFDLSWPMDRPAPVVAGRGLVTMPGANANRFNGSTKSRNDGIRVTVQEAGVLQSFPPDYPWQGGKTRQYEQVGNAVPPLLQQQVTEQLLECSLERNTKETTNTMTHDITLLDLIDGDAA